MNIAPDQQILGRIFASTGFTSFVENYKLLIIAVLAFSIISCFVFLSINLAKLSASSGNSQKRQEAAIGILVVSVCIAMLLSTSVIFGMILYLIGGQ